MTSREPGHAAAMDRIGPIGCDMWDSLRSPRSGLAQADGAR